jgi:hypothetical protein
LVSEVGDAEFSTQHKHVLRSFVRCGALHVHEVLAAGALVAKTPHLEILQIHFAGLLQGRLPKNARATQNFEDALLATINQLFAVHTQRTNVAVVFVITP